MKTKTKFLIKFISNNKAELICFALLMVSYVSMAQDGNAGITEATNKVRGYFTTGTNLMYAIGSIVGLVGAIKVFGNSKLASVKSGSKYGYIDEDGKISINPQFDEASQFFGDVAIVKTGDKYGLIDNKGKYIVNPQFEEIGPL